ncbi:hypothetical protein B0H14DRAFT_3734281, partial [Mycena olivaceomarginata]
LSTVGTPRTPPSAAARRTCARPAPPSRGVLFSGPLLCRLRALTIPDFVASPLLRSGWTRRGHVEHRPHRRRGVSAPPHPLIHPAAVLIRPAAIQPHPHRHPHIPSYVVVHAAVPAERRWQRQHVGFVLRLESLVPPVPLQGTVVVDEGVRNAEDGCGIREERSGGRRRCGTGDGRERGGGSRRGCGVGDGCERGGGGRRGCGVGDGCEHGGGSKRGCGAGDGRERGRGSSGCGAGDGCQHHIVDLCGTEAGGGVGWPAWQVFHGFTPQKHAPGGGGHAGPWDLRGAYLPATGCGLHGRLLVAAVVVVFLLLFAAAVLLAPHGLRLLPTCTSRLRRCLPLARAPLLVFVGALSSAPQRPAGGNPRLLLGSQLLHLGWGHRHEVDRAVHEPVAYKPQGVD